MMNLCKFLVALICSIMVKTAWGKRLYDFPSLSDICRITTSKEAVTYLLQNDLLEDKTGTLCGKVWKYQGSGKTYPPCTGILKIEGESHLGCMYWRCGKKGCQDRTSVLNGTLLDQLNIPLPDILQILYLSMLNIPVSIRTSNTMMC